MTVSHVLRRAWRWLTDWLPRPANRFTVALPIGPFDTRIVLDDHAGLNVGDLLVARLAGGDIRMVVMRVGEASCRVDRSVTPAGDPVVPAGTTLRRIEFGALLDY
jgi:hypothetical protein